MTDCTNCHCSLTERQDCARSQPEIKAAEERGYQRGYAAHLSQAVVQEPVGVPADLVKAIDSNVRAFRHKETGEIKYVLGIGGNFSENPDYWDDVMIIPDILNTTINWVLAAPSQAESVEAQPATEMICAYCKKQVPFNHVCQDSKVCIEQPTPAPLYGEGELDTGTPENSTYYSVPIDDALFHGEGESDLLEAEEYAHQHGLAVTDDWIAGWNDARQALAHGRQEAPVAEPIGEVKGSTPSGPFVIWLVDSLPLGTKVFTVPPSVEALTQAAVQAAVEKYKADAEAKIDLMRKVCADYVRNIQSDDLDIAHCIETYGPVDELFGQAIRDRGAV